MQLMLRLSIIIKYFALKTGYFTNQVFSAKDLPKRLVMFC